jgi:hypothetical protein
MAVWTPFAARYKANQIIKLTKLVADGHISEGLELYRNFDPIVQGSVKIILMGALHDCADFLDPAQNYRGDDTTLRRVADLKNSYEFAKGIGVSNEKLDDLVGIHDNFSEPHFFDALQSVRTGEKTIQVDRIIRDLKIAPASIEKQHLIPS